MAILVSRGSRKDCWYGCLNFRGTLSRRRIFLGFEREPRNAPEFDRTDRIKDLGFHELSLQDGQ
jgi:hypothetical protein